MTDKIEISDDEVENAYKKFENEAQENGYFLNSDLFFSKELVKSLLFNQKRYGYQACPCRLASSNKSKDLDIICPCDYRDVDLNDYGACYCALYVTGEVFRGEKDLSPIPERRNILKVSEGKSGGEGTMGKSEDMISALKYPVWRCKVCGYLCARENTPGICPVCKAQKDRFEKFL